MSNSLTFGYLYDFRNPPQWRRPWAELYQEIIDFAVWSESVGFDGAWVPEHHGALDGYIPSPMLMLAAIAARTSRIQLGSSVALAPLYNPVRFAEEAAVLDIVSNGRVTMSAAIGYRRRETEAYGVDFSKRGQMFDEFLEIVQRLWAGETVDFKGQHYQIKGARIMPPPPRGRIPLLIGGFVPKAMDRAVRVGDGYFGNWEAGELYVEKLRAAGKDPEADRVHIPEMFTVVARDPAAATEELAPYFHHINNDYARYQAEDQADGLIDERKLAEQSLEDFKASGVFRVLTPGQAIDVFRNIRKRIPLRHVMLALPPGLPPARFKPYAELLAAEVLPAFR